MRDSETKNGFLYTHTDLLHGERMNFTVLALFIIVVKNVLHGNILHLKHSALFRFPNNQKSIHPGVVEVGEIKGSLTRDFRSQVFFMNQCPPGP
jgi:hypothetical protein